MPAQYACYSAEDSTWMRCEDAGDAQAGWSTELWEASPGCGSLVELGLEVAASEQEAAHGPCQADPSRSRGRGRTLVLRGSLKFTSRPRHWEHLAGVCTGKLTTSHNPSLLLLPPQTGTGQPRSVHQGSWGGRWPVDACVSHSSLVGLSERETRAGVRGRLHAGPLVLLLTCLSECPECVCVCVCVCVSQTSTWSPSWAPPFLPRNWWPDYASYWEKRRLALLALLWRTGGKRG